MVLQMTIKTKQFRLLLLRRLDNIRWPSFQMSVFGYSFGVVYCQLGVRLTALLTTIACLFSHG